MVIDITGWYYIRLNIAFKELTADQNYHDYRIMANNTALAMGINSNPRKGVGYLSEYPMSDIVYLDAGTRINVYALVDKAVDITLAHTRLVLLRK